MTFYPASVVLIALWALRSLKRADAGIVLVIAVLPLGMFAALSLGGLSVLASHLLAMATIGLMILRWLARGAVLSPALTRPPSLFLICFAVYAAIASTLLVRIFAGEFMVFPMNVTTTGTAVSVLFPSTMKPLAPGMSNIAQTLYIFLSCGFFIAALAVFLRRSPQVGETGLVLAASLNIGVGVLDLMSLDALLSAIRTADYSLGNEHRLGGFSRVIGGYAEASAFGATSAAFFGYFTMSFLIGQKLPHGLLAFGSMVCTVLSFSSSGLVAAAAGALAIILHLGVYFGAGMGRAFGHWFVIGLAGTAVVLVLSMLLPGVPETVSDVLDRLLLSKQLSMSGMERGAWAEAGFDAFRQTFGLGAGAGSLRANGLVSTVLGSLGIPGALALAGFLVTALMAPSRFRDTEERRMFYAARILSLTLLSAMLLSATTPDPTLFLMVATAISVAVRTRATEVARGDAAPRRGVSTEWPHQPRAT